LASLAPPASTAEEALDVCIEIDTLMAVKTVSTDLSAVQRGKAK